MSERESADITQKDLLKLLFDQAQHNATREEVQAVDNKINELYQNVATKEDVQILNAKFDRIDTKIDKLSFFIMTAIISGFVMVAGGFVAFFVK
jgi:hypothetical protein